MPSFAFSLDRGYFYSLLLVSLLTSKLLHLFSHLTALPFFLFVLYFPTFLFPDFLVIFLGRVIFQRCRIAGALLSLLVTATAASQIGFFIETGGEIHWNMVWKVLREPEGFIGMLMSGFAGLSFTVGVLAGLAWLLNPLLYNLSQRMVRSFTTTLFPHKGDRPGSSSSSSTEAGTGLPLEETESEKPPSTTTAAAVRWARIKLGAATSLIIFLHIVRPRAPSPFGHMSGTLPFTLFESLWTRRSPFCEPSRFSRVPEFPFRILLRPEFWIPAAKEPGTEGGGGIGIGRGWRPGSDPWEVEKERLSNRPDWLPQNPTAGFEKWYRSAEPPPREHPNRPPHAGDPSPPPPPGYEPVLDPLKITNLDLPLLDTLQDALANVTIKHIILLSLESTRKDVFPLIKDGALYEKIMASRDAEGPYADLSALSKLAEQLTGEDGGFGRAVNTTFGGINVKGALTGSSFTLKSLLGSHCGVSPLAVDFLEELESDIYQPCLAHILSVMNFNLPKPPTPTNNTTEAADFRDGAWRPVFMQASTTKFDRQAPFLTQIGFNTTLVRESLQSPFALHPPTHGELNYFGYSETELAPYIHDLFRAAKANNERVFLSHLTSSTHHPWATPEEFGPQEQYWGGEGARAGGGGTAWNRYLNSIKWGDRWISEVLKILEEEGVAEETLVVMVGDHGFAFGESTTVKTTYANPHIKGFEVPLIFHHPSIPRLHLNHTTTSLTILPSILDLLLHTPSLNPTSRKIAQTLLPEYEGQSLLRPFRATRFGRQSWNFGVVNPGGTHLSVVSSAYPFRLVMPICESAPYSFTHLGDDPLETKAVESWGGGAKLKAAVEAVYGTEAGWWVEIAEQIAGWMVWEGRRRWGYSGGTRREDRGAGHNGDGVLVKDHWWET